MECLDQLNSNLVAVVPSSSSSTSTSTSLDHQNHQHHQNRQHQHSLCQTCGNQNVRPSTTTTTTTTTTSSTGTDNSPTTRQQIITPTGNSSSRTCTCPPSSSTSPPPPPSSPSSSSSHTTTTMGSSESSLLTPSSSIVTTATTATATTKPNSDPSSSSSDHHRQLTASSLSSQLCQQQQQSSSSSLSSSSSYMTRKDPKLTPTTLSSSSSSSSSSTTDPPSQSQNPNSQNKALSPIAPDRNIDDDDYDDTNATPVLLTPTTESTTTYQDSNTTDKTEETFPSTSTPSSLSSSSTDIVFPLHQQLPHSQPIPIQSHTPNHHHHHHHRRNHSQRQYHHNDTDLTQGLSLTPRSHLDSLLLTHHGLDLDPANLGGGGSSHSLSPSERSALRFYSQQSPKYFRQSSPPTPTNRHHHHHHPFHPHSPPKGKAAVAPTGPQCPRRIQSTRTHQQQQHQPREGGGQHATAATTFSSSSPSLQLQGSGFGPSTREDRHSQHHQHHQHHHHNRQHQSNPNPKWSKSRWLTVNNDGGGGGDNDVTMTSTDIYGYHHDPHNPSHLSQSPGRSLPQELLLQLHDLEHRNEDLSAEVVSALEKRGFTIHEVLGKGISSTVRRVTEKESGHEYAVKIIDISGEKGDADVVEQLTRDTAREIKVLRLCGAHENIIELYDVFETTTFIFLVFELCRHGELFDYLTSVVSLSEKRTRIIMRQLLEAVQFIHENNIVHRDLKPENILMDDNLNIKVSDFGFATQLAKGETLTELCGTPGYLAPEVLAHSMYENVDGYGTEVDMWACGVIMYTLLCGAPPFWNRRQMMMLRAIMNADYHFNSPEWDDISDPPKSLIQKLLVLNPKERLTAREALNHPFFHSKMQESKKFHARRKFRATVFCVIFYSRLNHFYQHPPPISVNTLSTNPYSIKFIRKAIDACAFGMYRHWVKRVDNQNRAALFEHTLREEWRDNRSLMALSSISSSNTSNASNASNTLVPPSHRH